MKSPQNEKEVQRLTDRLASLPCFLPRAAEKARLLPLSIGTTKLQTILGDRPRNDLISWLRDDLNLDHLSDSLITRRTR
ncbi:hypothetical protein CR513_20416, partial [Mucuna pruriens]